MPESAKECDTVLPEGSDISLGPGDRAFEPHYSDQNPSEIVDFSLRRGIMAEIEYPGIAKLVSRLVWDQETVRSSRTTRTKTPLKSLISEGFSYSLSIAAQDLTVVAEIRRLIVIFTKLYYNKLTVGLCAAKAAV